MRWPSIVIISVLLLLVMMLLCEQAEGRRSSGSSRSTSSSRSTRSSSSRSRSTSRSNPDTGSRSRSRSPTQKVVKKVKKMAEKLPKTVVSMAKITPLGRRMTLPERVIVWSGVGWFAGSRLRDASHFMHYHCRRRFTTCRDTYVNSGTTQRANGDYCSFVTKSQTCLTRRSSSTGYGCSRREQHWLRTAACDNRNATVSNSSDVIDQLNTTWTANEFLHTSVNAATQKCQDQFVYCYNYSLNAGEQNFCAMMKLRKACLEHGGACTEDDWRIFKEAACHRTGSELIEGLNTTWPANELLQMSVDTASQRCQRQFVFCYNYSQNAGDENFCAMVQDRKRCLETNSACTSDEWDTFSDAACKRSAVNWADSAMSTNYNLRVTAALVATDCQLSFEKCRHEDEASRESNGYCTMVDNQYQCLTTSGDCTAEEWQGLYDAACDTSLGQASTVTVSVLLFFLAPVVASFV